MHCYKCFISFTVFHSLHVFGHPIKGIMHHKYDVSSKDAFYVTNIAARIYLKILHHKLSGSKAAIFVTSYFLLLLLIFPPPQAHILPPRTHF